MKAISDAVFVPETERAQTLAYFCVIWANNYMQACQCGTGVCCHPATPTSPQPLHTHTHSHVLVGRLSFNLSNVIARPRTPFVWAPCFHFHFDFHSCLSVSTVALSLSDVTGPGIGIFLGIWFRNYRLITKRCYGTSHPKNTHTHRTTAGERREIWKNIRVSILSLLVGPLPCSLFSVPCPVFVIFRPFILVVASSIFFRFRFCVFFGWHTYTDTSKYTVYMCKCVSDTVDVGNGNKSPLKLFPSS